MTTAVLAFFATVAFASPQTAADPKSVAGPALVATEMVHDFGEASVGDHLTYAFELRNDGKGPLQIIEVKADCDCVTASYDQTIAPGASGKLRVAFDTTDMVGALLEKLFVLTNDPVTPKLTLSLTVRVPPVVDLTPGYARYIYVQKEVPGVIGQTLWAMDGKDFNVLSVKSPYPYINVSFREAKPEERWHDGTGKQWHVETVLSPDSPVGPIAGWVEVITDHPRQKTVRFQVTGFVRPVVAVTPDSADVGKVKLENPNLGTFRVQAFSTENINVTGVETDVKGLKVELVPVLPGHDYKVRVSLTPALAKGDFRGSIKIRTASAKAPLIEVPISGTLE